MVSASVGFQCPECVGAGNRGTRQARTIFGGRVSADPGYVSKALIVVTSVIFLLQQVLSASFEHRLWMIGGPVADPVLQQIVGVSVGEWYRLVTAAFLHGSILHLAFNMYALYLFGPALEAAFGRIRFLTLYLLSALGGSVASYLFSAPNQPSVGASGAIFGLLAGWLVVSRRLGRDATGLWVLLAINVVIGFTVPNIDWRAHFGGFVTGAIVAALLAYAPRQRRDLAQIGGCVVLFVLLMVAVTLHTADRLETSPGKVITCVVSEPLASGQSFLTCTR
jgi:membrane associated rhomboid family serine protease